MKCRKKDSGLADDVPDASQAQRSSPLPQDVEVLLMGKLRGRAVLYLLAGPCVPTARRCDTTPVTNRADKQSGRDRITQDREASKPSAEDWMR